MSWPGCIYQGTCYIWRSPAIGASTMHPMTPVEMLNELIRLGYITHADENSLMSMPSAYQSVPSIMMSDTVVPAENNEENNA